MIKRIGLAVALAFSVVAVAPALAQAQATQAAALSVDSSMSELLGNAGARAVLERHIPELVNNPQIAQAGSLTLRALAQYVPDQLPEAKLTEINTELAALSN